MILVRLHTGKHLEHGRHHRVPMARTSSGFAPSSSSPPPIRGVAEGDRYGEMEVCIINPGRAQRLLWKLKRFADRSWASLSILVLALSRRPSESRGVVAFPILSSRGR